MDLKVCNLFPKINMASNDDALSMVVFLYTPPYYVFDTIFLI